MITRMPPTLFASSLRLSLVGVACKGALALVALTNVVVLARALGPEGRGEYFLFVAALAVLTRVLDFGVSASTVIVSARGTYAPRDVHRVAVSTLAAVWSVASVGIIVGVWALGRAGLPTTTWPNVFLLAGLLALSLYEQVWNQLSVGLRQIVRMNAVHLAGGGLMLSLNLVLYVCGVLTVGKALAIFAGVLLAKVLAMLALARSSLRHADTLGLPLHGVRRHMLRLGIQSYPNSVAALLWARIPAFLLLPFAGTAGVGLFSVSQQVAEQLALPLQAIQDAIYRGIAGERRESASGEMNRILRFAFWGLLPVAVLAVAAAPLVIPAIYGPSFERSARLFQILVLGVLASIFPVLLSPFFFAHLEQPWVVSILAWLKVSLVLVLCLLLIPPFAELGAALAVVLTELAWSLLTVAKYLRVTRSHVADVAVVRAADVQRFRYAAFAWSQLSLKKRAP